MTKTIQYTPPGEIDGTPRQVAATATAQLEQLTAELARITAATATQVRNAYHQAHVDEPDWELRYTVTSTGAQAANTARTSAVLRTSASRLAKLVRGPHAFEDDSEHEAVRRSVVQ